MGALDIDPVILKRFEIVRLGGLSLGRATYEPGRRWSDPRVRR